MVNKMDGMKLIITIVERRQGKIMSEYYNKNNVVWHYQCAGLGTAASEVLDVLGFGTSEREILISIAPSVYADNLLYNLNDDFRGTYEVKGIVFDLKLTGLNNIVAEIIMKNKFDELAEVERMEHSGTNTLILVTVNAGTTDEVMETAKKAGARGGTIIRSRFRPDKESEQYKEIATQEEKEIIAIVAQNQIRNIIMDSINENHGIKTDAGAVVCSLNIDQVVRLS